MCSICGGTEYNPIARLIWQNASDRGRDDQGRVVLPSGHWIGNHRAIPTTEVEHPIERQPVGTEPKIVFNGIISNAEELGVKEGEADTSVLPRVLDFSTIQKFKKSLEDKIIGSYAMAVLKEDGNIYLACNYKPIWICKSKKIWYFSSLEGHFPGWLKPFRMDPYSVLEIDVTAGIIINKLEIKRRQSNRALVICSGGLDSTAVAAYTCDKYGPEFVTLIHFDYGCKATKREVEQIMKIADFLKCGLKIIKMPSFGGSSLLAEGDYISEGIEGAEYAHEWVPARNLLMLSLATAFAEAEYYGHIYLGTNLEEAGAYPDNEEQFVLDFNSLLYGAVQNGVKIEVHTPLGGLMKHEIIPFGDKYNTPWNLTWSCYRDGEKHCGHCGPCFMRKTAFERNGLKDPCQ